MNALPPEADLDDRIRAAEQALVARERRLLDGIDTLGRRVRHAASPWRLAASGVAVLLAGTTLWRVIRPSAAGGPVPVHGVPPPHGGAEPGGLPWVGLLGLLWPLLPARWRNRTSPGTVAAVLGVGMPLLQKWLHKPEWPPLSTVEHVDLARYAGTWHEIARLGAPYEAGCDGQPMAHYTLAGSRVVVENRCVGRDGRERVARGVARVVPGSGNARLEVNFLPAWLHALPVGWADYQILALDRGYSVALVGHPSRESLWVLSRTPTVAPATLQALLDIAQGEGFPVERLQQRAG
ncbi:MAG: lipocalin family protein [Rubrivivax sp.]